MSAEAEAVAHSYEFESGNNMMLIDLNLSLHHYSPTYTTLSPPSQQQHQEPSSAVSLSPAADRKVVVDLTKSIPTSSAGGSHSQNSTLSTTRKRTQHHQHPDEIKETHLLVNLPASTPSGGGGGSDEEELDGENSRKKLRLSRDQSLLLEDTFKHHNTLNPRQKQSLAKQLGLSARQVEVWFQNRRARTKLKQTEAECEYMKRNCETLMDRVQRLQREVNELRSLKLAPQIYMQMPPATTLALCPSCERVVASSGSVRVDCSDASRVGSVSGNLWASSNPMIHKPF